MVIAEPNKRRVSYIIPPPEHEPPLLDLPPFGTAAEARSYPLVTQKLSNAGSNGTPFASRNPFATPAEGAPSKVPRYARHQLGISSLALDTTTVLSGTDAPGGILYTGGKDGLVASWELHVPHTKRRGRRYKPVAGRGTGGRVRWERIGDGGADWDDPEEEDVGSHGDSSSEEDDYVHDQNGSNRRRRDVPFEDKWEIDREALGRQQGPKPTSFRESVQTHTDWVNAMVLCNMNQTIITASSDRTIRAWSPHGSEGEDLAVPALIGYHTDYVRSLAFAKHPSVLFSGSLDRDISIWDIANPKPNEPVLKVRLSEVDDHGGVGFEGGWGSIYALGVDPMGHMLAAGTPERVVRLWDPRAGDRSVTKLVGHSECVRSILLSDDGRYMLTGSSDTTIKLWSVGEHRCLHTFNHHTSSVWALFSNHPNLERFYSGSRDGHLCVVDVEQCGDMSEGECVVLAREGDNVERPGDFESKTGDEAIRSIAAMDDEYVWTATSSSDVRRWRDVGRRVGRLDLDFDGASYNHPDPFDESSQPLVQTAPLGAPFEPTSIIDKSVNRGGLTIDEPTTSQPLLRMECRDSRTVAFAPSPVSRPDGSSPVLGASSPPASPPTLAPGVRERLQPSSLRHGSVANSIRSISSLQAEENATLHGIPYESLVCLGLPDSPYSFGFANAGHHSTASLASGGLRGPDDSPEAAHRSNIGPQAAAQRAFEDREVASEAKPLRLQPDHVIAGSPGLLRSLILNDRMHILTLDTEGVVALWHLVRGVCIGQFAPADISAALELERGVTDIRAETKMHPQEVLELVQRRIEGTNSVLPWCQVDTKVGQITVHLEGDRVFAADILAEEVGFTDKQLTEDHKSVNIGKLVLANLFRGLIKAEESEIRTSSPVSVASSLPSVSRSPAAPSHIPIMSPRHRQRALSSASNHGGISPSINIAGLATRAQTPAIKPEGAAPLGQSAPATSGWLSLPAAAKAAAAITPGSPTVAMSPGAVTGSRDYFSLKKAEQSPVRDDKAAASPAATPSATSGSSILGSKKKFMGFGKKKTAEQPMSTVVESKREAVPEDKAPQLSERDKQQLAFLDTLRSHSFAPPLNGDAPDVAIPPTTSVIIAEQSHADGAYIVTYRSQVSSTERDMEPLEMNSPFWLLNYLFTSATPEERRPPKIPLILLPEGQSVSSGVGLKVQASRTARVRGVMEHLQSVLSASEGRDRQSLDTSGVSGWADGQLRPEDLIELRCGQHVADPDMKVGTLKHYFWRGGVDMVLHYKLKSV